MQGSGEQSLYGSEIRNEMLLKPVDAQTVLLLQLHNTKWAADIGSNANQKAKLIRSLMVSNSNNSHGLNAMREQYLNEFQVFEALRELLVRGGAL